MEISAVDICKSFNSRVIFSDLSITLNRGQRIGLVGSNGVGKSTILKILSGEIAADSGVVKKRNDLTIGYLPQDTSIFYEESIDDYLSGAMQKGANSQLNKGKTERNEELLEGIPNFEIDIILEGLGLHGISRKRKFSTLSSGQKSKVCIAAILLMKPDVFLLDEPTNNLDIPAIIWLQKYLANFAITAIVISHDRIFLDGFVNKIWEIDWSSRSLLVSNGSYSDYINEKQRSYNHTVELNNRQSKELQRLREIARRLRADAHRGASFRGKDNDKFARGFMRNRASRSGRVAKAVEKRIAAIEIVQPPRLPPVGNVSFKCDEDSSSIIVDIDNAVFGYSSDSFYLEPITLSIHYGERIAVIGENGSGKSTLLKAIAGIIEPLSGTIAHSSFKEISMLSQDYENLSLGMTIKEIFRQSINACPPEVEEMLFSFGFSTDSLNCELASLSPGERARLQLALFSVKDPNCLILDEPTNHLDQIAQQILNEIISTFAGTMVLASHDRDMLQRIKATKIILLESKRTFVLDDLSEYLERSEKIARRYINVLK